jgi:type IV pilus biogenesis/stability protein PilW
MLSRVLAGLCILLVALPACVPVENTQSDKTNAEYHYKLGISALNEQNPTEALKELLQAEKFNDRDPEIQNALAQAYWSKQAPDLAEERFKRAIALSSNDPKYYNNLGALYLEVERYDDAIRAFQAAADNLLFDRQEMAWTGIGLAYFQKQDYPAAQRAYRKAMAINPRYYLAPFRLGELYYNQERTAEALEMFTRTTQLAPTFPDGFYWLGLVYMKLKEPAKAKPAFLEVIRLAPKSDNARLAANYLKIINK